MWVLLRRVTFLSLVNIAKGVVVKSIKVEVILKWEQPTTVTKVLNFLGLDGYYQCSQKISKLTFPLTSLTKNSKFVGTKECKRGFQKLKKQLIVALVLTLCLMIILNFTMMFLVGV